MYRQAVTETMNIIDNGCCMFLRVLILMGTMVISGGTRQLHPSHKRPNIARMRAVQHNWKSGPDRGHKGGRTHLLF